MKIIKDTAGLLVSFGIVAVLAMLNSYVIPYVLTIQEYSVLQTINLIVTYITLGSLGYATGMSIKYTGKTYEEINLDEFKAEWIFYGLMLCAVTVIATIVYAFVPNTMVLVVVVSILPFNLFAMSQAMQQATGNFKIFSRSQVVFPAASLIFSVFTLFVLHKHLAVWMFGCRMLSLLLTIGYIYAYEIRVIRHAKIKKMFTKERLKPFALGFLVMLANYTVVIIRSLDRWLVKGFFTDIDFAYYAYAVSILLVIFSLTASLTTSLYSRFGKRLTQDHTPYLYFSQVFGAMLSSSYFIISLALNIFLPKYSRAVPIIAILLAAVPAQAIIDNIFSNLYKVNQKGRLYLITVVAMLGVQVALQWGAISLFKTLQATAFASMIGYYIWLVVSGLQFKSIRMDLRFFLFQIAFFAVYGVTVIFLSPLIGFIVFVVAMSLAVVVIYKQEFMIVAAPLLNRKKKELN